MPMETVLKVDKLTKLFKNGRGIENISFEIEQGDVLGMLGPNGSGKTTTMKAILGLCQADSGTIEIFGRNPEQEYEAIMARMGCLIESPALYEYLTAWQNLKLMARFYPKEHPHPVDDERIEQVLKIVGMQRYKKEQAGKFSLGMKQRLGLAMALLSEPELVLLDEPANGLDIEGMVEIREIITHMAKEKGITFMISSHLAAEIEKICNKVVIIHEGELLSFETMDEALRLNPSLEDYFLSKVLEKRGSRLG